MPANVEDSTEVKAAGGADDNDDDEEDCELDLSGIDEDELGQNLVLFLQLFVATKQPALAQWWNICQKLISHGFE